METSPPLIRITIASKVLSLLQELANEHGEIQISNRDIAQRLGCALGGVVQAVQGLEAKNYIVRIPGSGGRGSRYQILTANVASEIPRQVLTETEPSPPRSLRTRPQITNDDTPRDFVSYLERLAALHDSGHLTDKEFVAAKRKLLR